MAPPANSSKTRRQPDAPVALVEEEEPDEAMEELEAEEEEALMMAAADEGDDVEDDDDDAVDEEDEEAAAEEAVLLSKSGAAKRQHNGRQSAPLTGQHDAELKCSACEFTTRSRVTLQRHERVTHLKKKFFRCVKCNYVTHVKARYTKHVKYHSMPMIKCDLCEFRTPYKWNLDRHLKNHMGGGMYKCSLCNFTAHIKQSLTVHIQNHHLSPDKARSARRRNKVGASDQLNDSTTVAASSIAGGPTGNVGVLSDVIDAEEVELLRMERMDQHQLDGDDPEEYPLLDTESFHRHNQSGSTGLLPSLELQEDEEEEIKLNCGLKMSFRNMSRTAEVNGRPSGTSHSTGAVKKARPVPNLIPIVQASSPNSSATSSAPTILKIPQLPGLGKRAGSWNELADDNKSPPILEAVGLLAKSSTKTSPSHSHNSMESLGVPDAATRKRKSCFLDQLAQKLAKTNEVPDNSQSLGAGMAGSVAGLSGGNISWSSRCQHCRQRCKTRADLLAHLKQCPKALEASATSSSATTEANESNETKQQHPMENKVFVWTQQQAELEEMGGGSSSSPSSSSAAVGDQQLDDVDAFMLMAMMAAEEENQQMTGGSGGGGGSGNSRRPSSVAGSDASEASLVGVETAPGIGAVTGGAGSASLLSASAMASSSMDPQQQNRSTVRRVYRCPQCSFWATTASRFHVHMVGHTNTKPFECSQCSYRSNWRWDITKHIKLKAARDPAHTQARVVLLDASGERHYDQYDRYLVMMRVTESSGGPSLTHGRFAVEEMSHQRITGTKSIGSIGSSSVRKMAGAATDSVSPSPSPSPVPSPVPSEPCNLSVIPPSPALTVRPPPALNALVIDHHSDQQHGSMTSSMKPLAQQPRRTIWKCKRCTFKDHNRETVLQHIRQAHYQQSSSTSSGVGLTNHISPSSSSSTSILSHSSGGGSAPLTLSSASLTSGGHVVTVGAGGASNSNLDALLPPPAAPLSTGGGSSTPAFRCGVCNQVSNWKHVIQRHCRLKHNGNIQVIENRVTDDDGPELSREVGGDESSGMLFVNEKPTGKKASHKNNRDSPAPLVEEDSMGYMMQGGQYSCSTCPYVCKSLTDIELHRQHHKAGPGRPVKCTLCPFFVTDKQELAQHLFLHGMHDLKLDSAGFLSSFTDQKPIEETATEQQSTSSSGVNKRFHQCGLCPYVSESKNQYIYHRQFHRPRGAPYKCPQCSFNVSRRHLLNQHLPVHGISVSEDPSSTGQSSDHQYGSEEEAEAAETQLLQQSQHLSEAEEEDSAVVDEVVNNNPAASEGYTHLNLDPRRMVKLADSATVSLPDIPLTWVSRGQKFYKMFKCRHCPHVNVRKANIQEHEKRHNQSRPGSGSGGSAAGNSNAGDNLHACTLCNYRCNNAGVLSAHVKVHQNVLGIIHALVGQDPMKTDEEQLRALLLPSGSSSSGGAEQEAAADESCSSLSSSGSAPQPKLDLLLGRTEEEEMKTNGGLHFCAHCPARFLVEAELLIHQRFHGPIKLAFRCDVCSYTARQESHLMAHWKVHSSEYQERTRILTEQHGISAQHPQPLIKAVMNQTSGTEEEEEVQAMDLTSGRISKQLSRDDGLALCCPLCPAKFGRESTALLQYHSTLHGSDGPFKCRYCDYAVKAQDNLTKHERLHLQQQQQAAAAAVETAGATGNKPNSKRYQCSKCPSAFEKKEQFKIHSNLHGSKQRYRCDRCDYAVKYYANFLQHVKKHDEFDSAQMLEDPSVQPTASSMDQVNLSTADRQHIWLRDKLQRSPLPSSATEEPFTCQYCPFRTAVQTDLASHTANHACQGATGSYRCNFCDFTVAEQSHLSEHIQLHFQLKGRTASRLPESYWKCSNLEIWSEPVNSSSESPSESPSKLVFNEKCLTDDDRQTQTDDEEDEDALYIDLSTGQPLKDDPNHVEI